MPLIFERFRQSDDSSTRHYGGAGLGLTISKAIVEKMGGSIWFSNNPENGTTFFFTIPFKEVAVKVDLKVEKEILSEKKNILIVEDDTVSAEYIAEVLNVDNYNLIYTRDGKEAVEYCKTKKDIDLILMDIQLPILNGEEATRQIREFNKDVPIIAQTANAFNTDKDRCMKVGCNDYIAKPITPESLKNIVKKYIR